MKIHVDLEGASADQLGAAVAAVQKFFDEQNIDPGAACLAADELKFWDFDGPYEGKTPLKQAYVLGAFWSDAREVAVQTLTASTGRDHKDVDVETSLYLSEE